MNMLVLAVAAAATVLLAPALDLTPNRAELPARSAITLGTTDRIIGDGDFNQVRSEYPADPATEHRNHTLRLQYIESLLRSRDVSGMPAELRAERMRNLERLHAYWTRGEFPINYEHPTAWEPCFIDKEGRICAVGYLVEQSLGRETAEKIDARYHFATIKQIDAPALQSWIAKSGLTKAEVVTIQGPSLGPNGEWRRGMEPERVLVNTLQPVNAAVESPDSTAMLQNTFPVQQQPASQPAAAQQVIVAPAPAAAPAPAVIDGTAGTSAIE